jgi:GYF domain 2
MADRWYYAHDEIRLGPFTGRQLRDLADAGQILQTDTIWKDDITRGVSAYKVKYLFVAADYEALPKSAIVPPVVLVSPAAQLADTPSLANLTSVILSEPPLVAPETRPPVIPENSQLVSEENIPVPVSRPIPPPPHVRKRRAAAGRGATIVSQDGTTVKYRKKCTVCGHEDSSWGTMPIPNGMSRTGFYCPKCRKRREVEIQGFPC